MGDVADGQEWCLVEGRRCWTDLGTRWEWWNTGAEVGVVGAKWSLVGNARWDEVEIQKLGAQGRVTSIMQRPWMGDYSMKPLRSKT